MSPQAQKKGVGELGYVLCQLQDSPWFLLSRSLAHMCQGRQGGRREVSRHCLAQSVVLCFLLTFAGSFTHAGLRDITDVRVAVGIFTAGMVLCALHLNWKAWEHSGKGQEPPPPPLLSR